MIRIFKDILSIKSEKEMRCKFYHRLKIYLLISSYGHERIHQKSVMVTWHTAALITLFGCLSLVDVVTMLFSPAGACQLYQFLVPFIYDLGVFMAIKNTRARDYSGGFAGISRLALNRGDHAVLITHAGDEGVSCPLEYLLLRGWWTDHPFPVYLQYRSWEKKETQKDSQV